MKRKQKENPVLPTEWTGVVEKVQEVLTETESVAAERERQIGEAALSVPIAQKAGVWKESLEHFEERLRLFQAAFQKAEESAEEADLALADGEKTLQKWLTHAEEACEKVDQLETASNSLGYGTP